MQKTTRNWEVVLDEVVADVALFFLVLFTTVATLNFLSFDVIMIGYGLFVVVGCILGCLLRKPQRTWENDIHERPDLNQVLEELRKVSGGNKPTTSTEQLLKRSRRIPLNQQSLLNEVTRRR